MSFASLQRVCILGSTGSVGASTLDVLSRHRDRYQVFALTAHGVSKYRLAMTGLCPPPTLEYAPILATAGAAHA